MSNLQEVTDRVKAAVGDDSGLGKSLKFDLKGDGFIHTLRVSKTNQYGTDRAENDKPIVGQAAVAAEGMSDAETVSQVTAALQEMFGSSFQAPTSTLITRWASDPFSYGSYSFLPVGATPAMRQHLAAPLGQQVFFAGEATHPDYAGTGDHLAPSPLLASGLAELADQRAS